jgi:hypothetical protein
MQPVVHWYCTVATLGLSIFQNSLISNLNFLSEAISGEFVGQLDGMMNLRSKLYSITGIHLLFGALALAGSFVVNPTASSTCN